MRPRIAGEHVRRRTVIGHSKIMTDSEQQVVYSYLAGKRPGIDNITIEPHSLTGARALMIYQLMIVTGIRTEELCNLRICDTPVCLGSNCISIYRGKNDVDREVPISGRIAEALELFISEYRPQTMPRYHKRSDISLPVFYSQARRKYTTNALYKLFRRIGQQSGLAKRLHPHMFRHTFAVNSLRNKVDIYLLKTLMGHSSLQTTAQYLHVLGEHLKGLGEELDRNFRD